MSFDIDIAIVVGFLVTTLVVGLGHGSKIKTIKDYALGGRNFSTAALVATLTATGISGSGFFITLSKIYSDGLYYLIASTGIAASYLLLAIVFVPRMGEFLGNTSIAEAMGDLYGNNIRMLTAIAGSIGSVGSIAVQFKVFGNIFVYFAGGSLASCIIIAGSVVTIYSAFGGVKAVTYTDMLQFFTFGVAIPIIGVLIWNHAYELNIDVSRNLQHAQFSLSEILDIKNPEFFGLIALFLYFFNPSMSATLCQRIMMGKDIQQVKKAFLITAALIFIIKIAISWIPFLLFSINPTLATGDILGYIIDTYTYVGFKGILIIGVVAMAMSTADSKINISSVLFANDLCKPLGIGFSKELLLSKLSALALGGFAITLALVQTDLLSMMLFTSSFYMPTVSVTFMMAVLGFRTSSKSATIGIIAGFVTIMAWKLSPIKMDGIFIAMLINVLFTMGSHYLLKQPGGWVGIKDKNSLVLIKEESKKKQLERAEKFKDFSIL